MNLHTCRQNETWRSQANWWVCTIHIFEMSLTHHNLGPSDIASNVVECQMCSSSRTLHCISFETSWRQRLKLVYAVHSIFTHLEPEICATERGKPAAMQRTQFGGILSLLLTSAVWETRDCSRDRKRNFGCGCKMWPRGRVFPHFVELQRRLLKVQRRTMSSSWWPILSTSRFCCKRRYLISSSSLDDWKSASSARKSSRSWSSSPYEASWKAPNDTLNMYVYCAARDHTWWWE